jgi:hypothetical protein
LPHYLLKFAPLFIAIAKSFFLPLLTLTLSPRRGERGKEEETFGNPYEIYQKWFRVRTGKRLAGKDRRLTRG